MLLAQVNRALCAATALLAACAPSGTNSAVAESATVAARAATPAAVPAAQDSNITIADLARTDGSTSAPIWVIVVSDFQCPYCKQWHDETFPALLTEFVKSGKARVAYVNYPLSIHAQAWPSAEAAMCAGAQGKFWQMHDAIFDTQAKWASSPAPAAIFDSLARSTGVDMRRWSQCVSSGTTRPLIQADQQRAAAAGVRSTPTILIGNEMLAGAHPIESIRRVVNAAIANTPRPDTSRR
ncbi:MAG TPA: thioredoxin domain-containing protein [Gemmatimonadaceae bacterium]|nr:thioredoxin domain-containing protein [Gemmatimonadaceae bacterium]